MSYEDLRIVDPVSALRGFIAENIDWFLAIRRLSLDAGDSYYESKLLDTRRDLVGKGVR